MRIDRKYFEAMGISTKFCLRFEIGWSHRLNDAVDPCAFKTDEAKKVSGDELAPSVAVVT
jgi:hypothetical protein